MEQSQMLVKLQQVTLKVDMKKCIVVTDVVMTLLVPAEIVM